MPDQLRILFLEDNPADAELEVAVLAAAGFVFEWERVETRAEFLARLNDRGFDLILADYNLPSFDGLTALKLFLEKGLELPFILVSGTLGEEQAIESLKSGATDYVLKTRLERLPLVVERALREGQYRRERRSAEHLARKHEMRYRALVENMLEACAHCQMIFENGKPVDFIYLGVNQAFERMTGLKDATGKRVSEVIPGLRESNPDLFEIYGRVAVTGRPAKFETYLKTLGMWFSISAYGSAKGYFDVVFDNITERKRAEHECQALFEISQGMSSTADLDELLSVIHQSISKILYAENCFVALCDKQSDLLSLEFFVDQKDVAPAPQRVGRARTGYVFRTGKPILMTSEVFERLVQQGEVESVGTPPATWLGVPLRTPTEVIGVLVVQHYEDEHAYSQRDLEFLSSAADQVALAIERKRTEEQIRDLSRFPSENPNPMLRLARDGTFLYGNAGAAPILKKWGVSKGTQVPPLILEEIIKAAEDPTKPLEIPTDDRVLSFVVTFIRDAGYMNMYGRDITAVKQVEDALRASEERYRDLVENAHDIIYSHDLKGNYTSSNRAGVEVTGYSAEESRKLNFEDVIAPEFHDKAREMMRRKLTGEDITTYGLEMLAKDGHRIPVEVNSRLIYKDGVPVGVTGIARDITERKRAAEVLEESERRFRQLADNINEVFWMVDPIERKVLYVSPAYEQVWGRSRQELYQFPETFPDAVDPEDKNRIVAGMERQIKGEPVDDEYRIRRPDGTIRWIHDRAFPIKNGNGIVNRIVGIAEDITERKLVDTALRQSEERFRNLVETTSDWIWEIDENGNYTYVSPRVRDLLGYETGELLGRTPFDFMPPEQVERVSGEFAKNVAGRQAFRGLENRNTHKAGHEVVLETSGVPILGADGEFRGFRGIDRDITDRKRTEEALKISERRYRTLFDSNVIGIQVGNASGHIKEANDKFLEMFGFTRAELETAQVRWDTMTPAEWNHVDEHMMRETAATGTCLGVEKEFLHKDGHRVAVRLTVAMLDENGADGITLIEDITDRKQKERQLSRLATAVEQTVDSIMITDTEANIEYVNPAFERITGYAKEDALGQNPSMLKSGKTDPSFYRELWETITRGNVWTGQLVNKKKDGTFFNERATISPILDESGKITSYIAVKQDITREIQLEEQLRPVPLPFSLVVKNGSKMRARVA
ncbi:MAG: PAS domain S-box protein [Acidobacteriota bacterium]